MLDVSKVKGVGPKSLMLLNKIGIKTVDDLVEMQGTKYIPEICKYCQPGTNTIKFINHTINNIRKEDYLL